MCVRRPRLRLLALAVLGLSNPVSVAILQAQTETTLVSNTGQTSELDNANIISQLFTTGSQTGGYEFTTVDVYLGTQDFEGGCDATGSVEVSIRSNDSSNEPASSLYSLTAPGTLTSNGFNTFTASAGASLSADTSYHVYVAVASDDYNTDWCLGIASSTSEDDGGSAGWSIGDRWIWGYPADIGDDAWYPVTNGALRIKIARVDRPPDPDPDPDPDPEPDPDPPGVPTVTASCEPCTVGYGGEVQLTADAQNLDGDSLSYQWYAPEGWLKDATRAAAWWKAPNETGRVWLRVRVSDGTETVSDLVPVDVDPTHVPALPLGGAVLLGLLLVGAGLRRRRTAQ